jgi:DNA-binding LytR/AlgR family response regulator
MTYPEKTEPSRSERISLVTPTGWSRNDCLSVLGDGWISLRHTSTTDVLRADCVISVHAAGNNTIIVTNTDRHTVHATIRSTIEKLEPFGLIRIHRGAAINITHVRRLIGRGRHRLRIVLDTGDEMAVGRSFERTVRERFGARASRIAVP